jgi:hypothetical protein
MEDLDAKVDINSTWETIRRKIKISAKVTPGYFELKKDKPWLDEGCSTLLDQRKEINLEWLQNPSEINGDNMKIIRSEASKYFRNKKTTKLMSLWVW